MPKGSASGLRPESMGCTHSGHRTPLQADGTVCPFSRTHSPAGLLGQGRTRLSLASTEGPGRLDRRQMTKGLALIP